MTGAEIAEILARWTAQGVTGAVEWRDGKRRRLFFFEGGQLVALQSNLKSESPARVAEGLADATPEQLRVAVAAARLRGALEEIEGSVEAHIGATPPAAEPVDLLALLWSVADTLPRPPSRCYPQVRPGGAVLLSRVPFPPALGAYIADLDGSRSAEDVISFGPTEPELTFDALSLGVLLGANVANPREAPSLVVTTQRVADTPVATAQVPSATADEIGALITEGIGAAPNPDGYEVVLPRARADRVAPSPAAAAAAGPSGASVDRVRAAENHFEVLGVDPGASVETMRRAYLALAKELHPDRWASADAATRADANELFDLLRAAWEVLSDDEAREAYISRVIRGEKTAEEQTMDRLREILDAEADFKRGLAEMSAGRHGPASELFGRAAAAVPEDQEMAGYAAYATFRAGGAKDPRKAETAIEALTEAVKNKEKFDQGHVMIGQIHRLLGDEAAARQSFIAALRIRPTNPDATRELKRGPSPEAKATGGGFFSRLFGKK